MNRINITDPEIAVLKKVLPELKLLPGTGYLETEEEDELLWAVIEKIKQL